MRIDYLEEYNKLDLIEDILDEDLESIYKKYYSEIPRKEFDRVIELDPTFNRKKDQLGIYCKWLLNQYQKGNKWQDAEIKDQLKIFHDNKARFDVADRDIFKYKTAEDFFNFIYSQQKTTDDSKSHIAASKIPNLRYIGGNNQVEIYSPETHEASRWARNHLNGDAVWCTGRDEVYYWNEYTQKRKNTLYMFINLSGGDQRPDNKYQLAIDSNGKVTEFRDAENHVPYGTNDYVKALKAFIIKHDLLDVIKNTELKNSSWVYSLEQLEKVKNGEPVIYRGGVLEDDLKMVLKNVQFDPSTTSIAPFAFEKCLLLESIEIPDTIKEIGKYAFSACTKLTNVKLPNNIKQIEIATFANDTSLGEITLPMSCTFIDKYAFRNCDNVVIKAPRRHDGTKLGCTESDVAFIKDHLVRFEEE